jgi:O-antigen ligase
VAIAIHLGASVAESLAQGGIQMLPLGNVAAGIMSVIVGLVAFACGGYVAARIRQPAALFMAAITFALVVFLMVTRGDALPIWYQILYLVLGPLAPMAGGAVASRQRLRQIHE